MKGSKRLFVICCVALMAVMAIGTTLSCASQGVKSSPTPAPTAEFEYGTIDALSGPAAVYGSAALNGRELAVEEINAKGGISVGGTQYLLKPISIDEGTNPTEAVAAFTRLITENNIKIIQGVTSSTDMGAIAPLLAGKDLLILTDQSADPRSTQNPQIYGARVTMATYNAPTVYLAQQLGAKTAVILYEADHAGIVAAEPEKVQLLEQAGIHVLDEEVFYLNDTDFTSQLTKIKGLNPDVVICPAYLAPAAGIITQFRELGLKSNLIMNAGMPPGDVLKVLSADVMQGIYNISAGTPTDLANYGDQKAIDFNSKYQKRFGVAPGYNTLMAYDATYILAKALEKAGTVTDLGKIKTALDQLKLSEVPEVLQPFVAQPDGTIFKNHAASFQMLVEQWEGNTWHVIALK